MQIILAKSSLYWPSSPNLWLWRC